MQPGLLAVGFWFGGGIVEADPLVVGLVVLAVCIAAFLYVARRLRARRRSGGAG